MSAADPTPAVVGCPSRCGWNDPCANPWHDRQRVVPDTGDADALALEDWLIDNRWPHAYDLSRTLLASDWRAAHDAEVCRETAERIAQAITADRPEMGLHINITDYRRGVDEGLIRAARIAREVTR